MNDTAFNLCAATYYVRGEDTNGCASEDTILLTEPTKINTTLDVSSDAKCANSCDGSATILANGGSGALTFSWLDGDANAIRNDLCPGENKVYVSDENSCRDSLSFTIGSPSELEAIITDTTHIFCDGTTSGQQKLVNQEG